MKGTLTQFRSFDRPVQLLLLNQLTINIGFYMLMPYLAAHLSEDLGLAAWLVGLTLGIRNLSQQGMFLIGGSLADRLGYKPMIVAGCALRTVGFALLGFVDSLPALIAASAATGFAGALFNPAVRAYVAHDAGERRVEAFALFNVFYQAGILIGPLIGLVLTGVTFRLTCGVAAAVFAALTVLQIRALPARKPAADVDEAASAKPSLSRDWRTVFSNRPFLLFSAAMIGSYVLSFQVYLALPLEARRLAPDDLAGTVGVGTLFAISGLLSIVGQVRITAWCKARLRPGQSLVLGVGLMGAAFLPPLIAALLGHGAQTQPQTVGGLSTWGSYAWALLPILATTVLLTLGTIVLYPFEMDTIVGLSGGRLVATHYGLYSTMSGIGITAGNLFTGGALDAAASTSMPALPWLALLAVGGACALAVARLDRAGQLTAVARKEPAAV